MASPPNTTAPTTALTGSDQTVLSGGGVFFGGTFTETGGSTAGCIIYDNTANSGTILAKISLASGGIEHINFANGLAVVNGIRVDITSGSIAGSIHSTS
jgi:hypothetical protein